ncbi:hypothetical protein L2E82_11537 [Cichorium intybus]|uniref:Uncharacterized protein n=1 Tax=Cichorium intybus TaxID=13427 RepID=A0ACB9GEQ2_CICIN|nr:hypothetical protein L2E82_11537 [Cichorium intybus]
MNVSTEIKTRLLQGITSFNQLKHVHARLLRFDLLHDNYLLNMLLRSSFNFNGNTNYSQLLFTQIQEPNIYVWNTLIHGLVSHDHFQESIKCFYSMRQNGFLPNFFTFPFVLKACTRVLDLRLGVELHTIMVKVGYDLDAFVKTGLVCFYAKSGRLDDACKVFDEMPEKNPVSWTAIISGYIEASKFKEALDIFKTLLSMNLRPDSFTLVKILSACSQLGDLRTVEWLDKSITTLKINKNIFLGTALVDTYSKCGSMEKAHATFDQMLEKDAIYFTFVTDLPIRLDVAPKPSIFPPFNSNLILNPSHIALDFPLSIPSSTFLFRHNPSFFRSIRWDFLWHLNANQAQRFIQRIQKILQKLIQIIFIHLERFYSLIQKP